MPRAAPPFLGFSRTLCPSDSRQAFETQKAPQGTVDFFMFFKKKIATTRGLIKKNKKNAKPPRGRPILGEKSKSYTRAV